MIHNYNSTNNQHVLRKLVEREIIACQSYLVTELLKHHYDEAEWINEYTDNSEEIEELQEEETRYRRAVVLAEIKIDVYSEELQEAIDDNNNLIQEEIKNKIDILTSGIANIKNRVEGIEETIYSLQIEEEIPKEIYEWWLVTSWFEDKLKEKGEVFLELFGETWWGRQCTGQAILLDYVIGRIGEDIEILEGQSNHKFWVD
jgi:hypothetical protein